MLKKPDREDRGLNKRDFYDGLNARRKWLWSSSLTDTHTHSPPSLSLIHSLTLCDALLHSSLPGAVKKARETHKSKLKCSSECFLDVMHGPWDAARPCCYTCKPDVGTVQQKKPCYFPSRTAYHPNTLTFLDWDTFWFQTRESNAVQNKLCGGELQSNIMWGFECNKEVARLRCHSSFCGQLPHHIAAELVPPRCFSSEHQRPPWEK